jgi:hypothetical protein
MTEAEARALLAGVSYDKLGPWIAEQLWQVMPGGWRVEPALRGWRFRVEVAGAGQLRITANTTGGNPAVWSVPLMPG